MPGARVEKSPIPTEPLHDISAWVHVDISKLNSKNRKSFGKREAAIIAYFTSTESIQEIARHYSLPVPLLQQWADKCLMVHEDGEPWGFRALVPGVTVVDHAPTILADEITSTLDDPVNNHNEATDVLEEPINSDDEATDVLEEPINSDDEAKSAVTSENNIAEQNDQDEQNEYVAEEDVPLQNSEMALTEEEGTTETNTDKRKVISQSLINIPLTIQAPETPIPPFLEEMAEEEEEPLHTPDVARAIMPFATLYPAKSTAYLEAKKVSYRRRVHKRWMREDRLQHRRKRLLTIVSLVAVAFILIGVAIPLGTGLAAYSAYNNIRSVAYDGIDHLLAVKDLFATAKSNPMGALNADKLKQAQGNFQAAESDFLQLQQLVNRPDVQSAIQQFAPQYSSKLGMAQRLIQVALDVSQMGNELSNVGVIGANVVHSSPLASGSTTPLITASDIVTIEASLVHAQYYINDITAQMSQVSLNDLPISTNQKNQLTSVLVEMPKIQDYITQARGLIPVFSWLLGVGQARRFLVQTMDNAELRPGGGFTGQYGILQVQNGRVGPLGLTDVAQLDYNGNGIAMGRLPPAGYGWMNFGNWGLRDSNLSADVPTDSRMVIQDFQDEGGGPVDGDITFTPTFIGHIIDVTGPVHVSEYGEVITSQNLADRLHYYQQNQSAITREQQISGNYSHTGRKAFTSLLGKLLLEKVRQLPTTKLLLVIKNAVKDIQSRDLNIYFTNPIAENWLVTHGYSGTINSYKGHDGFMVVQANISISKASQYVQTTEQDNVTLDAQGGATHNLTITLNYQQRGPIYGFDTYADYIRVYAPANAQFLSGDGFDTGQSLCKPNLTPPPTGGTGRGSPPPTVGCGQYNTSFPSSARYCPNGDYSLGLRGYRQGATSNAWPVDSLGSPPVMNSDIPGYAMWGGMTETPKNCISYISLSWYVPHVVHMIPGQSPYGMVIGKQGGMIPTIQISIDDSAIRGLKPFTYNKNIVADTLVALPNVPVKVKKK